MAHTAVFLLNLGGPRILAEVEPYLYELFSDPLLISAPFGPFRPLFAKLVKTRAPSSAEKYALIGGRSPLVEGTEAQARALEAALGDGYTSTSRCAAATRAPRRACARRSPPGRSARSPARSTRSTRTRRRELAPRAAARSGRRAGRWRRSAAGTTTRGYLDASAAALRETSRRCRPAIATRRSSSSARTGSR